MLVAIITLLVSLIGNVRNPLLPEISTSLRIDVAAASTIVVAFGLGRLIADLPAGYLADRYSPRWILVTCAVLLGGSSLGFALATELSMAVAATTVTGIVSSLATGTAMTVMTRDVDASLRATSLSIYTIALHLGAAVGPLIGGVLNDLWDWRTALAAAGGMAVFVLVPALMIRAALPAGPKRGGATDEAPPPLRLITRLGISTVPFAIFFVNSSLPQVLIPYIGTDDLGISATGVGLALALGGAARIAGGWIFGRVADKVSRHAAIVPSMLLMIVAVLLLALPPNLWIWVAAVILMMFAVSTVPAAGALLADRVPRHKLGMSMGIFRLIGDVGMLAGPLLAGVMYENTGAVGASLVLAGVLLGLLVFFLLTVPRPKRGR